MSEEDVEGLREEVASLRRELDTVRGVAARAGDNRRREEPNRRVWQKEAERAARRRARSTQARVKRFGFVWIAYMVGSSFVILDPGGWWHDTLSCVGAETSAAVAVEPAAVRVAKGQARILRKLTGPPPKPAQTMALAHRAADAFVASSLAFTAQLHGEREPAAVTSYSRAHAAREAQNVASKCGRCPVVPARPDTFTVAAPAGLDAEQQRNAATVLAVGRARGVPARGQVVAIAAALQESGLRNLPDGDRDSVGVFQQRAGWGPLSERMNPSTAAGKFYDALVRVPGWQQMTVTRAAQAVQRSAYPNAYARWEGQAAAVVAGGVSGAQLVASSSPTAAKCGPAAGAAPSTYRTGAGVAWGGYQNGQIPVSALAHPSSAPRHLLRPDAAAALDRLSGAYRARFGRPLGVTDSYRDLPGQRDVFARKPGLAAKPGTSNHGWALAVDVVVGGYGSTDYLWLRENAPGFGWDNPGWARPGGSRHEPWHWEFNPIGATA